MGFADRAVTSCLQAMRDGRVSERHVRDVLRSRNVDGSIFVEMLSSEEVMVRRLAARIVAEKGPIDELVKAAMKEEDRSLLLDILQMLGKKGAAIEILDSMLRSEDGVIRDAAIDMFRKAGKPEFLFPLVFSKDDAMSSRIKRYLDEKGKE